MTFFVYLHGTRHGVRRWVSEYDLFLRFKLNAPSLQANTGRQLKFFSQVTRTNHFTSFIDFKVIKFESWDYNSPESRSRKWFSYICLVASNNQFDSWVADT